MFVGPAGVLAPTVKIIGPTVMNVSWVEPLQPNGMIEFYTIRLPEPRRDVRNVSVRSVVFEGLTPYTEYAVTVTACTSRFDLKHFLAHDDQAFTMNLKHSLWSLTYRLVLIMSFRVKSSSQTFITMCLHQYR